MRVVGLISGGKDSCYNMMQCIASGHEIVALANLTPQSKTEIDSYMYQSVGFEAIDYIAAAMDLPLYRETTLGHSHQQGKTYEPAGDDDEVEDLYALLKKVKEEVKIEAVSVGAILSDYQRIRVENVCVRLGLVPLAYLWQRDQKKLLNEMIRCEIDAVVIKVAALGLDPVKHLGRTLSSLQAHLHSMHEKYGLNVCGEGGEYETLTLDCPLFRNRIKIEDSEVILHTNDPIAQVGYLKLNQLSLETKLPHLDLPARFANLPLKDSDGYVTDYGTEACEFDSDPDDGEFVAAKSSNSPEEQKQLNDHQLPLVIKQKCSGVRSSDGWLWIGGIQGDSCDSAEAMQQAADSLKSILAENEQSVRDVCSITMYISDMGRYGDLNRVYCETFNHPNPPTRACVEIPSSSGVPVILSALSWSPPPNNSGDMPVERSTMHVQSRSHWAPANIGPYSQAVKVGDIIHLAGQIGLVPGNLDLVQGGIRAQCHLALRHVARLLKAVDSNVNLRDVVQGICYVTQLSHVECARKLWEERSNNAIVDYVVVTRLPRDALIEWQVWAHRHNNQFEYEETGKCIEKFSISIYRRWNYENNIAAIVCHLENTEPDLVLDVDIFRESVEFTVQKLKQGHENDSTSVYNLNIFYRPEKLGACGGDFVDFLDEMSSEVHLVCTFVPVSQLKTRNTLLSICGVRNQ